MAIRRVKPVVHDTILAGKTIPVFALSDMLLLTIDPRINRLKKLQSSVKENCADKRKNR